MGVDGRHLVVGPLDRRSRARSGLRRDERRDHHYYGGHHPGDNLFSTSVIALDAETGERRWHYQFIHHDIWNYDTSQPPLLMDVVVDGRPVKGLFQATKQAFLYALDRETGEPIWPIEERPVPASTVPGEQLSPTQPFPTTPPPFDLQGRDESMLIDYTPEIRERALQVARDNGLFAPLFAPPTVIGGPADPAWFCPSDAGGANIFGNVAADPTSGLMFIPSTNRCGRHSVMPAIESPLDSPEQTGRDYSERSNAAGPGARGSRVQQTVDGLPIWKGPDGRIVAYDLNRGEIKWTIPPGDAAQDDQDAIRNHPLLQGIEIDESVYNRGRGGQATLVVSPTLLFASGTTADNTSSLFAIDKETGERVGQIELPSLPRYGMSSWEHDGHQVILVQLSGGLAAFRAAGGNAGRGWTLEFSRRSVRLAVLLRSVRSSRQDWPRRDGRSLSRPRHHARPSPRDRDTRLDGHLDITRCRHHDV